MSVMKERYFVEQCPLQGQCSSRAWKNAHCVSWWSVQHCQKLLFRHLVTSSLHYCDEDEAHALVSQVDVMVETVPSEWQQPHEKQPPDDCERDPEVDEHLSPTELAGAAAAAAGPTQPAKPPPKHVKGKDRDHDKRSRSRDKKPKKWARTPSPVDRGPRHDRSSRPAASSASAASRSSTPPSDLQLAVQSKAPFPILQQEMVSVPRQTLQQMLDCVERSLNATSHAVRLAGAARSSFETEEKHLSECVRTIEKLVNRRDL